MEQLRSLSGCRKRSSSSSAGDRLPHKRRRDSPENFFSGPRGRSRVRRESRLRQQRAQELLRKQATSESLLGNQKAETQLGNQSAAEVAPLREQGLTSTESRKRSRSSSEEDEDEVAGTQPAQKKQRAVSGGLTGVFGGFTRFTGSSSGMQPRGLERPPSVAGSKSDSEDSSDSDFEEEEIVRDGKKDEDEEEVDSEGEGGEREDDGDDGGSSSSSSEEGSSSSSSSSSEEGENENEDDEGEGGGTSSSEELDDLPDYESDDNQDTYLERLGKDRALRGPQLPLTPSVERLTSSFFDDLGRSGPSFGQADLPRDPVKKRTSFPTSLATKLASLTPPVSFDTRPAPSSALSTPSSVTQRNLPQFSDPVTVQSPAAQLSEDLPDPVTVHPPATQSTAAESTFENSSFLSGAGNESEHKPATVVGRSSAFEKSYSKLFHRQRSENEALQPQSGSQEVTQASSGDRDRDPQLPATTDTRDADTRRAPTPPSFTEEEVREMMARHEAEGDGPDADDFEILRLVLEELEDRMDLDSEKEEDVDAFNAKQKEVRQRLRNQRDTELREVKEFERLRESVSGRRKHFDEASSARPTATEITNQDDLRFLDEFTDPLEELELEKARLSEAETYWKSAWPNPIGLPSQHWNDEATKYQTNERTARDVHEQIYWSNLRIQACAYAKRDIDSGNSCRTQIRVALLDWKRNVAAVEATLAAAKQVDRLRVSDQENSKAAAVTEEDPRVAREAPLREKLGRLLTQLPPELDQKVTKILDVSTNQVITKTVESVNITRRDIAKILHSANFASPPSDPPGWLNDEIINAFFAALTKALNDKSGYVKSPNNVPPYVTYNSSWLKSVIEKGNDITAIQRWSRRKGITGSKALKCKRIFFPVNPGNHWTLLIISPDTRTIEYLDSLDTGTSTTPRKATRYINLARAWLKMELGKEYVPEEWTELDRRSPIQDNGSDCGMFACLNGVVSALEFESPTNEFGPEQIPYARRALISMLDVGGFQDYFEL